MRKSYKAILAAIIVAIIAMTISSAIMVVVFNGEAPGIVFFVLTGASYYAARAAYMKIKHGLKDK